MAQVQNNRPQGIVNEESQQQINSKNNQNVKSSINSWSFKTVSQKDKNNISWPFKVIRDEGKPSKMEIRSMSDLNRSFEGTKYTLTGCSKIQGRYSLIYSFFNNKREKNIDYTSKITHLLFTYGGIYYMLKGDKDVKFWNYDKLLKTEKFYSDMEDVTKSVLYNGGVYSTCIRNAFNNYKVYHTPESEKILKDEVGRYISGRTTMKVLDSEKAMIDILNSDLNFTSLTTVIFVTDKNGKLDFSDMISDNINKFNISESEFSGLHTAKEKIPTFYIEENRVLNFIEDLKRQKKQASIRTFYKIPYLSDYTKEGVKRLFDVELAENYQDGECEKYVSPAELAFRNQKNDVNKEKDEKERKNIIENIIYATEDINKMIKIMVEFTKSCDMIHSFGKERNSVEYGIWMKQYSMDKIGNRLNILFNNTYNNGRDRKLPIISVITSFNKYINKNLILSPDEINYFYKNICPTNFSDQRYSLKMDSIDFKTLKGTKVFYTIVVDVYKSLLELFEMFLGLQYAMFGSFVMRYGENEVMINIVRDMTTSLKELYNSELPMTITENVKEAANKSLFLIRFNLSDLKLYNKETLENDTTLEVNRKEDMKSFINKYSDFVVKYLKVYGEGNILEPVKSKEKDGFYDDLTELFDVAVCINNILSQCNLYVDLPLRDDTIDKIIYSDIK